MVALNIYPKLAARALDLLGASPSSESVQNAILQWRADDLEAAAAEAGLRLRHGSHQRGIPERAQYTEVLSKMPLITVEKIGESEPMPFKQDAKTPLDGIRALGMGHVIAGAAIGRDLAYYGADVLNIWRPNDTEIESFTWDAQVGMRSTILDHSKEDRAKFDRLLKDADSSSRTGAPAISNDMASTAEELSHEKARTDPRQGGSPWRAGSLGESGWLR